VSESEIDDDDGVAIAELREGDELRWLLDGGPAAKVVLPAHIYDQIKALGWDTRRYIRQKPLPKMGSS
jgi:hypothetical protein